MRAQAALLSSLHTQRTLDVTHPPRQKHFHSGDESHPAQCDVVVEYEQRSERDGGKCEDEGDEAAALVI
ncbi:hypothetical protein B5807_10038 [Epicoccum nigrum]|uniref:Uncharacterized protein n=1 Tax=Epicoccum nigrum TaxID=105696 RepID=A0A1Y2LTK4_EPING|nr:hypothetical protein B5807_10038 [Epicoccum nigrum]